MADIAFICSNCEQKIEAPEEMAGLQVECPSCQRELLIPTQKRMLTLCPLCDGRLTFRQEKLGKLMKCPHCQGAIEVGSATALPQPPPIPPPPVPQPTWKPPQRSSDWQTRCKEWFNDVVQRFSEKIKPTATKEELQTFIQRRLYYYIPRWEQFDPSLKKIKPGTFNWVAFFFTVYWMAYRKMYLYTAIIFIVLCVISAIITNVFITQQSQVDMNDILTWKLFCSLIVMFLFGRYGNCLYKNHVEAKIREAKRTVTAEYLNQAYRDLGGTSWIGIILLTIWAIVWAAIIGVIAFSQAAHGG